METRNSFTFTTPKENYIAFKTLVKERWTGDKGHALYTAWYIFKHNLKGEDKNNYIHQDFEKSRKHFTHHGFDVSITLYGIHGSFYSSGESYINETRWKQAVEFILDIFYSPSLAKLQEEYEAKLKEQEEKKRREEEEILKRQKFIAEEDVKRLKEKNLLSLDFIKKLFNL